MLGRIKSELVSPHGRTRRQGPCGAGREVCCVVIAREHETGRECLGKQIADRDNARDNRPLLWMAAMVGIATAFIGPLIRLQILSDNEDFL